MYTILCWRFLLVFLLVSVNSQESNEGCAHVTDASATQASDGTWTVSATVSSNETGWDKYANEWRVSDPDGTVLGTRTLAHPHVNEQPFTRSLTGVTIPENVTVVTVAAQDSVLGYCGDEFSLQLNGIAPTPASTENSIATNDTPAPALSSNASAFRGLVPLSLTMAAVVLLMMAFTL